MLDGNGNVVGSSKIAARHVSWHPCVRRRCLVLLVNLNLGDISCSAAVTQQLSDLINDKMKQLTAVFETKRVHNVLFFPQAITETAFTRVVLPMPIFVLPPIIMSYLERFVQRRSIISTACFYCYRFTKGQIPDCKQNIWVLY